MKVDISNIYTSFVSLGETKEKTKDISEMSTFLKIKYIYIYLSELIVNRILIVSILFVSFTLRVRVCCILLLIIIIIIIARIVFLSELIVNRILIVCIVINKICSIVI